MSDVEISHIDLECNYKILACSAVLEFEWFSMLAEGLKKGIKTSFLELYGVWISCEIIITQGVSFSEKLYVVSCKEEDLIAYNY